eukprot:TRINITY_DN5638_c0_g1_i1.p2 TRINITY_DN5638_c0_g1~~TRINITY_DN5638_c0_g1_i1.p2  ORF type:complete len:207 (+),score=39.58 TRINITY_DN5638_c0_g1_i1:160-780(+)
MCIRDSINAEYMGFEKIYKRLDIKIKEMGESFYKPYIKPTIEKLEDLKLVEVDKGAKVIRVPKIKTPLIVVKSDGGFSYDSTDMAAIWYRLFELKRNHLIYITDSGQKLHFDLVFGAAKLAGWHVPPKTRIDHMGFGLVLGEDGSKIKTRSGESAMLIDLLNEAANNAYEQLVIRNKELCKEGEMPSEEELKSAGEKNWYGLYQVL